MPGPALLDALRPRLAGMTDVLGALVAHESPSLDKPALDGMARTLAARFAAIGGEVEVIANPDGGDHLIARFFPDPAGPPPALLLAHFDTVWSVGTLAGMPWRVEAGRAFGPGAYDMKASLVLAEFALKALGELGLRPPRPVELILTSDEEIGSPTSRRLIERRAGEAAYALVLEPPLPDGSLKTARKGVGQFLVTVEGRAAHAGVEPEKGLGAIDELARQVLYLHALTDLGAGTTVNVGVVEGGTAPNVVAARASARVDVRVATAEQALVIEAAIRQLSAYTPGIRLAVEGGFNRPPMERTPAVAGLVEKARVVGRALGLDLSEGSTGGGSDGNFTAALGLPTLDGLGARGAGAHAHHEQVDLDSLPERAALLAALLMDLRI